MDTRKLSNFQDLVGRGGATRRSAVNDEVAAGVDLERLKVGPVTTRYEEGSGWDSSAVRANRGEGEGGGGIKSGLADRVTLSFYCLWPC